MTTTSRTSRFLKKKVAGDGLVWKTIHSIPAEEDDKRRKQGLVEAARCCFHDELRKVLPFQHLLVASSSEFEVVKHLGGLNYRGTVVFCTGDGRTDETLFQNSVQLLRLNSDTVRRHHHRRQLLLRLVEMIKRIMDVSGRIIMRLLLYSALLLGFRSVYQAVKGESNNHSNPPATIPAMVSSEQPLQTAESLDTHSFVQRLETEFIDLMLQTVESHDTHYVVERLQTELMNLTMSNDPGIYVSAEENNIFCWKGTITVREHSVYKGIEYALSLSFPTDYPLKAPKVKFETPCFHPNVDVNGNICLDILQEDKWSSAYDARTILLSVQSLLREPNTRSPPLNEQAAALWGNQEEYKKMVDQALQLQ